MAITSTSGLRQSPKVAKKLFTDDSDIFHRNVFYIDLQNSNTRKRLQEKIQKRGGKVDDFLHKDVQYVITDEQENTGKSPQNTPNRPKAASTPRALSRGQALLQKSIQNTNSTQSIPEKAKKMGIKVVNLEFIYRKLKERGVLATALDNTYYNREPDDSENIITHWNGGPYIKFQDSEDQYRPFSMSFERFPFIQLDSNTNCDKPKPGLGSHNISLKPKEGCTPQAVKLASKNRQRSNGFTSVKKSKLAKDVKNEQSGYCEMCEIIFENFDTHTGSEKHQKFAHDDQNFKGLDTVIDALPSLDTFLDSLQTALAVQSEDAEESICPNKQCMENPSTSHMAHVSVASQIKVSASHTPVSASETLSTPHAPASTFNASASTLYAPASTPPAPAFTPHALIISSHAIAVTPNTIEYKSHPSISTTDVNDTYGVENHIPPNLYEEANFQDCRIVGPLDDDEIIATQNEAENFLNDVGFGNVDNTSRNHNLTDELDDELHKLAAFASKNLEESPKDKDNSSSSLGLFSPGIVYWKESNIQDDSSATDISSDVSPFETNHPVATNASGKIILKISNGRSYVHIDVEKDVSDGQSIGMMSVKQAPSNDDYSSGGNSLNSSSIVTESASCDSSSIMSETSSPWNIDCTNGLKMKFQKTMATPKRRRIKKSPLKWTVKQLGNCKLTFSASKRNNRKRRLSGSSENGCLDFRNDFSHHKRLKS